MSTMFTKRGHSYRLSILVGLILCQCSLPLILAQVCPKQCHCIQDKIQCPSPSFPIILPSQKISDFVINGNFLTLPTNAVVQPKGCILERMTISSSYIFEIKPYSLSGLKAEKILLSFLNIIKLQPKAFANVTCKIFNIYYSSISTLQMDSFNELYTKQLLLSFSHFYLVSLKPSHLIKIDSIKILMCHICVLDIQLPIGNQSVTIAKNIIQSFEPNSTIGGVFDGNQILCSCNLTFGWFANEIYKKYLFNNTCLGRSDLNGLRLIDVNQTELCSQSQQLPVTCMIHSNPRNSASEFFNFTQALTFFLGFVLLFYLPFIRNC